MKFGVHHGTNVPYLKFKVQDVVKSSVLADELGYDSIWVQDHLNWTPLTAKTQIWSAFILLGHLANKIKNATIGTCVTDPHRRHPAQTALDALTLQDMTNGRFILGMGAGEAANLSDFGVPWNKPVTRLTEACKIIKALWDSSIRKAVDFEGEFFHLKNAGLQFKVPERPKLYMGANSPRTIRLTGEIADGWMPNNINPELFKQQQKLLKESGRDSEIEKCVHIWISVSKDNPELAKRATKAVATNMVAREEILSMHGIELPEGIGLKAHFNEPVRKITKSQNETFSYIMEKVPEELITSVVIAGKPNEVIDQIDQFVKVGAEHFIFEFTGEYYKAMKLFAEEVMPHFK